MTTCLPPNPALLHYSLDNFELDNHMYSLIAGSRKLQLNLKVIGMIRLITSVEII